MVQNIFAGQPPAPSDASELARWEHTRQRRRLLYSCFEADLAALVVEMVGRERSKAWGRVDTTANPYLSLWEQSARLYAVAPDATHPDAAGQQLLGMVADAGLWSMMHRVQRDTLALREMVMHIDLIGGRLVFRPVFPDLAEGHAAPSIPDEPVRLSEWREDGDLGWLKTTAEVEGVPLLVTVDRQGDRVGPALTGDQYPLFAADGSAVLPYVVYHAADTGWLWDPYTLREIVDGSLNLGMYLTMFGHCILNASWPQRAGVGVEVEGLSVQDGGDAAQIRGVPMDPAKMLMFRAQQGATPMLHQFEAGSDPEALFRAISLYERRLLLMAGLHPPDVTRQQADIRSGYSLAVARESVREQQRLYEPAFRRADEMTLRACAAVLNTAAGSVVFPEDGYVIKYRGLPPSPVEDAAKQTAVMEMVDRGIITGEEAREMLTDEIARLRPS